MARFPYVFMKFAFIFVNESLPSMIISGTVLVFQVRIAV